MPADLDLVVRLDLRRLRAALGGAFEPLSQQILSRAPSDERDAATGRLLLELLLRADTVWLGARPGLSAEQTDSVVMARGAFASVVPDVIGGEPAWQRPERLGGGVLRFERPPPPVRAQPAVLYVKEPDLVVIGSAAELDALELTLERGAGDEPLRAKESGIVSLRARVPKLAAGLRARAPTLSRLIEGADLLSCLLDRRADRYELELELEYESRERASQVAGPMREVFASLSRAGLEWLSGATVTASGRSVAARLSLESALLERLLACRLAGNCGERRRGEVEGEPAPDRQTAPADVLRSAPP